MEATNTSGSIQGPTGSAPITPHATRRPSATPDLSVSEPISSKVASTAANTARTIRAANQADEVTDRLAVGRRVRLQGHAKIESPGTIRFCGETQFAAGIWVGVELDSPEGKNNGEVMG